MSDMLGHWERVMLGVKNGAEAGKQVLLYKIVFSPDASWPSVHSTTENKCCCLGHGTQESHGTA